MKRKVLGWILFGVSTGVLLSSIINIVIGSYVPPSPSCYQFNMIACLVLVGIAVGGWKLAHRRVKVVERKVGV